MQAILHHINMIKKQKNLMMLLGRFTALNEDVSEKFF